MDRERIMIFIDGSNVYSIAKNMGCIPNEQNYQNLILKLTGQDKLIRVYFYTAMPDQSKERESYRKTRGFLNRLEQLPCFEICFGKLKYPTDGSRPVQKGVDVKLATDILEYAHKNLYDNAIIVSGDADIAYVLPFVKDKGKHVTNAFFKRGLSNDIRQKSDFFIELDCNSFKK